MATWKVLRQSVTFALALQVVSLSSSSSLALAAPLDGELSVAANRPSVSTELSPEAFLVETNAARAIFNLSPLTFNPSLAAAAQSKANDMVARGYWDHFRPSDQKAPWDFIREAGYEYAVAGENLARGFRTAHGITEAWMESPSHRANLLSVKYNEVGYAVVRGTDAAGEPALITVQMFGAK